MLVFYITEPETGLNSVIRTNKPSAYALPIVFYTNENDDKTTFDFSFNVFPCLVCNSVLHAPIK